MVSITSLGNSTTGGSTDTTDSNERQLKWQMSVLVKNVFHKGSHVTFQENEDEKNSQWALFAAAEFQAAAFAQNTEMHCATLCKREKQNVARAK